MSGNKKLSQVTIKLEDWSEENIRIYLVDENGKAISKYGLADELIAHISNDLWSDRGAYDASTNLFPSTGGSGSGGAILNANVWTISTGGTLGGTAVVADQTIRALTDTPGQTAGNWQVAPLKGDKGDAGLNGTGVPLLDELVEDSTDGVENGVVFDEFEYLQEIGHNIRVMAVPTNNTLAWINEAFVEIKLYGTKIAGSTYHTAVINKDGVRIRILFFRRAGGSWIGTGNPPEILITDIDADEYIYAESEGTEFSVKIILNPSKIPAGTDISSFFTYPIADRSWKSDLSFIIADRERELQGGAESFVRYFTEITGQTINESGSFVDVANYSRTDKYYLAENSTNILLYGEITVGPSLMYNIVTFYNAVGQVTGSLYSADYSDQVLSLDGFEIAIPANTATYAVSASTVDFQTITVLENKSITISYLMEQDTKLRYLTAETSFIIPAFIDAVLNKQCNIFLDSISLDVVRENKQGVVKLTGDIEIKRRNNLLQYIPTVVGSNIEFTFTQCSKLLDELYSATTNFRQIPNNTGNGTDQRNIMLMGDSLTDNEYLASEVFSLLGVDADYVINQIGTRGTAAKHEGRISWKWYDYVHNTTFDGKTNPFLYSDGLGGFELDIAQYIADNTFAGLDYVLINLGTNDTTQGARLLTFDEIDAIILDAKIFIDAVLADYPSCKICIGLPAFGAPFWNNTSQNASIFQRAVGLLSVAYLANFDNGEYHANVTCFNHGSKIDRYNSYPFTDNAISDRISETVREWTNNVHPLAAGYYQWSDAYYAKIRALMYGLL